MQSGKAQIALEAIKGNEPNGIKVSMEGKGRWIDNVYIERLSCTIKYELIYLRSFTTVPELIQALGDFICFYNEKRLHQSLEYKTPAEFYQETNQPIPLS